MRMPCVNCFDAIDMRPEIDQAESRVPNRSYS